MQYVLHLTCLQISKTEICSFLPGMLCVDSCSSNILKQSVHFYTSTSSAGRSRSSSSFSFNPKEEKTCLHILM